MNHPLFEIVTTTAGAVSIRNKMLGEIMHNPVGPWREANALYIDQSKLAERLRYQVPIAEAVHSEELVVFDVGLGAAANALAALHCAAAVNQRPLHIVSFERELELLRYALSHASEFEHFHGYETAITELLANGLWQNGKLKWELRTGDFRETLPAEKLKPHLIFYDPYSSKVNREMWSMDCFRDLRQKCREANEGGTALYTYSQATPVRVALLSAGFYVGHGLSSGPKEETTQAATVLKDLEHPLAKKWFERWGRSRAQVPFDCPEEQAESVRAMIRGHAQFTSL